MAGMLLWSICEFCSAQKIGKKKEWRAAGRQCSGAQCRQEEEIGTKEKNEKNLYNQEVVISWVKGRTAAGACCCHLW